MNSDILPENLWLLIQPLLPKPKVSRKGGRPRVEDRRALIGILVVLRFSIPWKLLPKELGCGSGSTCRRRLIAWQKKGVWTQVWKLLLDSLGRNGAIDLRRVSVDGKPPVNPRSARAALSAWCGHAPAICFSVPPQLDRSRCAAVSRRLAAERHVHRRLLPTAQGQPRAFALLAAGAG
jgi:transposase